MMERDKNYRERRFFQKVLYKNVFVCQIFERYTKKRTVILIRAAYYLKNLDITIYKNPITRIFGQKSILHVCDVKYEHGMKIARWWKNLGKYPARKSGV